ncbi:MULTISPECIES: class III extradiol ring-cleavage dioxygenase [Gammaproteobacteria]|uniref:DODA-type extradiol aromatic ring-opening family dioxygenase n=1 Tax=Gammaproteobacteria TaxID=1236 RepID=UPI000DCFB6FD|nr:MULTISPECIES: class III extradiol ring-cleavage dioxygenase [Gammaproteobacteria]RTE85835.1 dioxygenase [Aliidiomarina sp. B3213]TCZ90164.1 dioxygenase [Lysobacter sp. N42]
MSSPSVMFVSHGGGPLPLLGDAGHKEMVSTLNHIASSITRPKAIVVISAHWETETVTINTQSNQELLYDYYGFPEESYEIQYPATSNLELGQRIEKAFKAHNIAVQHEQQRGFDHGVFVPLKIMYPEADIPVVQVSLKANLDPEEHITIGRVLKEALNEDVLVLGSGFSFHNMQAFRMQDSKEANLKNQAFEDWLVDTCYCGELSEQEREQKLVAWEQAPSARFCHPREEHLIPLHVCYGAALRSADAYFSATILGKKAGMFYWRES